MNAFISFLVHPPFIIAAGLALLVAVFLWHNWRDHQLAERVNLSAKNLLLEELFRHMRWRSYQLMAALALLSLLGLIQLAQPAPDVSEAPCEVAQAEPPPIEQPLPEGPPIPQFEAPNIVEDLFGVQESLEPQTRLDALKRRYEQTLVVYYYLRRCAATPASDYYLIHSMLLQELAWLNAPAALMQDILTAAKGSFEVLYATAACEPAQIERIQSPYAAYLQAIAAYQNQP